MSLSKFALRNFAGKPVKYFTVESEDLGSTQAPAAVKKPSHHILVIDRSGSMYGDMAAMTATVEKLLTLAEFNDDSQRVSLISYSSMGDVKLHFNKVTVGDVMQPGSPYLQAIRSIRVTGLTCISQSLSLAEGLVDDNETTCISLHTDGYANDRSPSQETRDIQTALDKLKKHPALFVNTVAHRDWCDFNLMSSIANQMSGVCIQAKGIKGVYDALYNTQGLLNKGVETAIGASIGDASYVGFVSLSAKKVLGSNASIMVKGLLDSDDKTVYRYTEVDEASYNASTATENPYKAIQVYARCQLAEGNLNAAKYALVSLRNLDLLKKHYRALVGTEVAALVADLEQSLFSQEKWASSADYGLGASSATVLQVLSVLGQYPKAVMVNVKRLSANYKRRGLKKVAGVRKEDGTLEAPTTISMDRFPGDYLPLGSVDANRNTATINILVSKHIQLVTAGVIVEEVAGIKLDNLKDFRNFTIVGDGQVCTPILPIKVSDKRCFKALADLGVVSGDFDPNTEYDIALGDLPLVDFDASFAVPADTFGTLARLTAVSKILSAVSKESSEAYTAEQIAALKGHYLTSSLYFSPPTTNSYTDLTEALNKGEVDSRLSYKVEIGTADITALSKLPSANAFLERRFTLTVDGADVPKPKMTEFLNPDAVWGVKALGPKIKLTPVDELLFPLFSEFLGLTTYSTFSKTLHDLDASLDVDVSAVLAHCMTPDGLVEFLSKARKMVDSAIDDIYTKTVSPLVFFVGSTGIVPDEFGCKAMSAEQIEAKFPTITLSKDEKDGTFFVLPNDVLLTVFTKGEYFTVAEAA